MTERNAKNNNPQLRYVIYDLPLALHTDGSYVIEL